MTRKRKNGNIVSGFTAIALVLIHTEAYTQITIVNTDPDSSGRKYL